MESDDSESAVKPGSRSERGAGALLVLALLAVAAAVTYLGPILKPFLVAVFLYYTTRFAAAALVRLGLPAWLAYLTLFVASVVVAAVVVLFVYSEARSFRADWPRYEQRILALVGERAAGVRGTLEEMLTESSRELFSYVFEAGVGALELILMTCFYLLFLILSARRFPERVMRAFPGERGERILAVGDRISDGMEQFMKVKTLVSVGMGVTAAGVMYLFGLDHWLLWGFLFFALNYITYIGSIAACVPPIVIAFLDLDSVLAASVLAGLIVVNRFLWIDWVEIRLSGKHLNIDSVLLFLWLAYWGWSWGVLGLILAYPMIASLKIVLEHLEGAKAWAMLMSEE